MRAEDLVTYNNIFPKWATCIKNDVNIITMLSPDNEQVNIVRDLFPECDLNIVSRQTWDLNKPAPSIVRADLICAMNVFMYSPDPALWFKNVFASCKYFWIQDLVRSKRDPVNELGSDQDAARYQMTCMNEHATPGPYAFDLTRYVVGTDCRLLGSYFYQGAANSPMSRSFLISLRGDL